MQFDIIFTFKGLLNEQARANIRNEVAHGIIGEYACSTGVCLYFGVAVIKLLSYTSSSCGGFFFTGKNVGLSVGLKKTEKAVWGLCEYL